MLDVEEILASRPVPTEPSPLLLGRSREGRPIHGFTLGHGPLRVTLIAGCHADEPVGPAMLERLVAWLASRPATHPALQAATWYLVPHTNPDGDARNQVWAAHTVSSRLEHGREGLGYDLLRYLRQAIREPPGDDVEFGFPRHEDDQEARPENLAVARFLRQAAPVHLHASFHGMAFAAGPWFLLEPAWVDRSHTMRQAIREAVRSLGYILHDIDRGGDKGFQRIDEGFTTRPNAQAMIDHFEGLGDAETAARFRPSSMDFVRTLGGDPMTLVSEMPLFVAPAALFHETPIRPPALERLQVDAHAHDPDDAVSHGAFTQQAAQLGVRAMPIDDQMRLQLTYLTHALDTIGHAPRGHPVG